MVILRQTDVSLPRYWRKRYFTDFEKGFKAFAILFWALCWFFCVSRNFRCQDKGEEVSSPALKPNLRHSPFFLALWWLFCVNLAYSCKDMEENVLTPLKLILRHSRFLIEHFGAYFASIGGTVAMIRANTLLRRVLNRFYTVCRSFWSNFLVILRQSSIRLPRYRVKHCFTWFKIEFTAFAVLFGALWWIFCVNWTYRCQDTGENITWPAFDTGVIGEIDSRHEWLAVFDA